MIGITPAPGSLRQLVEAGLEIALAAQADDLFRNLAVLKNEQCGDGAHAVFRGEVLVFVNIDLADRTLPEYSSASSSRTGAIILQGPHHSAQKSTSTGVVDFRTCWAKLSLVRMMILLDAMIN